MITICQIKQFFVSFFSLHSLTLGILANFTNAFNCVLVNYSEIHDIWKVFDSNARKLD